MRWDRRVREDLEREIEHHIALETDENIARGMTADQARHAALLKFGNPSLVVEDARGVWVPAHLDTLWGDVRHAFRKIRRSPGTAALVVFSLALAFAPSVAVFAIMDRLFLAALPVRAPDEIFEAHFRDTRPGVPQPFIPAAYSEVAAFRQGLISASGVAFHRRQGALVYINGRRAALMAHLVNEEYFKVLGIPLHMGPGFSPGRPSVIISHSLWTREFNGRPDIIGQPLLANGQAFMIDGVAAPGFQGVHRLPPVDLWTPVAVWLQLQPQFRASIESRDGGSGSLLVRLRPHTSNTQLMAEVEGVRQDLARHYPTVYGHLTGSAYAVLAERRNGNIVLTAIGVLILGLLAAVACANVAGILLARAEERRHETAVRQALGASRGRLVREWMVESSLLALLASAFGLVGAAFLMNLAPGLLPSLPIPLNLEFTLGPRVWIYAILLTIVSSLSFGLVPAWRGSRPDLLEGLRRDAAISVLRVRIPIRSALIVGQVAAAEVLLFFAGLAFDALSFVSRMETGIDPERRVAIAMVAASEQEGDPSQIDFASVSERLASLPGVRRAVYGKSVPLSGMRGPAVRIEVPGFEAREGFGGSTGPGFLSTLGVRLLAGRDLERTGGAEILINETLARVLGSPQQALGRSIRFDGTSARVVGVFRDAAWNTVHEPPAPRVISLSPERGSEATFAIEVSGDPETYLSVMRSEMMAAQPGAIVLAAKTLAHHHRDAIFVERAAMNTLYALGLLAILMTATGLHGITAAHFARRSKEFAVRLVLGAVPRDLAGFVTGSSLKLAALGLGIGLAIAIPAALVVRANVQGISPWSAPALGLSSLIVLFIAAAASAEPARRVLRIQPAEIVRNE